MAKKAKRSKKGESRPDASPAEKAAATERDLAPADGQAEGEESGARGGVTEARGWEQGGHGDYQEAARDPGLRTLAIDVGASGIKGAVLSSKGSPLSDRLRVPTPRPARPETVLDAIAGLTQRLPDYDRVSVGFPGVVHGGWTFTAPNLDDDAWRAVDLAGALRERLGRPARVLNDAEVQGLGAIQGEGTEVVITLGTGFGFGLFRDGRPAPHLEIGHHPFRRGETYEEQLGNEALERIGPKKWNRRLRRAIATLRRLANFDRLYIGGGNARRVDLELDPDVVVVSNDTGIQGGIALWRDEDEERTAWLESGGSPEVL